MIIFKRLALASLAVATLGLTACGGGSNGSNDPGNPGNTTVSLTGVFIDSPVDGLRYVSKSAAGVTTHSGATNAKGEFQYESGGSVTFSIGDITFPPVAAKSTLTPLDVAGTSDVHDTSVVNIARLLQSLDFDGDPSNGIKIGDAAHTAAAGMGGLDFASATFDSAVTSLVANSGSTNTALVDADSAINHFTNATFGIDGGIPRAFSMEWLRGRTLYPVWFGTTDSSNSALPRVIKVVFNVGGTATVTGLMNLLENDNLPYKVIDGSLFFDGSFSDTIVCGSTSKYIKTHLIDNEAGAGQGVFQYASLFFFNEADALAYAATLTKSIEPCEETTVNTPSDSTTIAALDTSNISLPAHNTPHLNVTKRWALPIPVKSNGDAEAIEAMDEIERQLGYVVFDRTSIATTPDADIDSGLIVVRGGGGCIGRYSNACGSVVYVSSLAPNPAVPTIDAVLLVNLGGLNTEQQKILPSTLPVAIHEFGHALGLRGHFGGFGEGGAISPLFWRTLKTLYLNPAGTEKSSVTLAP